MSAQRGKRMLVGVILASLILCGCQGKDGSTDEWLFPVNTFSGESVEYEFLGDVNLEWKDNSLDDWQAVTNLPMEEVKANGEQAGGRMSFFACEHGAVRFKNHLLGYKNSWSGASGITPEGEEFSERITVDSERIGMQVDLLGPVSGRNGFVAFADDYDEEDNLIGQRFYELNDKFEVINSFETKLFQEDPLAIMGDGRGNIHLTYAERAFDGQKYVILSSNGEVVFEALGDFDGGFRAFGDGQVAACGIIKAGALAEGFRFLEANLGKGDFTEIGSLRASNVLSGTDISEKMIKFATPVNEREIVWCGNEGVYLCNAQGEKTRIAYHFSSHGITLQAVADVHAKEDGTIAILYQDAEGMNYLLLKPTTEKTEIKKVIFAVAPYHKDTYASAVAYFNKKYPAYNIEVKDDYDETSLLTQLGAGGGPVLVDTALTGFEELEKLWQPLDGFLEKTGLADELIPEATELGKIGERTYGIATNFAIRAMIVTDSDQTDWDYEGFLKCVEKFDGAAFTATWFQTPSDERDYFFQVLGNGLYDNAYWDQEKGSSILGTPEFERVLRIAEKAGKCPGTENGSSLRDGKALCELLYVTGAEGLVRLRARKEAGENVLGYPTKNGAKFLLSAQRPIAVRITATEEEKTIAYTFFRILLSHDGALSTVRGNTYSPYSIRRDVLKDQFDHYENVFHDQREHGMSDMPELDREKDGEFFEELLRESAVERNFPPGLQRVFDEEFRDYFDGKKDGKALAEHLKSRVWLYLEEEK